MGTNFLAIQYNIKIVDNEFLNKLDDSVNLFPDYAHITIIGLY